MSMTISRTTALTTKELLRRQRAAFEQYGISKYHRIVHCKSIVGLYSSLVMDELKCYEGAHFTLEGDSRLSDSLPIV